MPLKPADIIAGGALVLTGLANMKANKKWIPWVLVVVGTGVLVAAFWPSADETRAVDNHNAMATTTGLASPAASVSGIASGGTAIVNQAGGNLIINNGISPEEMAKLLKAKALDASIQLTEIYPLGYTIFGVANGQIIFEPHFDRFQVKFGGGQILIDYEHREVTLKVTALEIDFAPGLSGSFLGNDTFVFTLVENEPMDTGVLANPKLYFELLDKEKGICLLGWRR
jgi:hypothetical protein